jgi:hypothetical protein
LSVLPRLTAVVEVQLNLVIRENTLSLAFTFAIGMRAGLSSFPQVALLKQTKGVGTLIALTFLLTLEDPHRFRKSRDVGCYLGLLSRDFLVRFCRYAANLLHCRSPFYLCLEHVDNLGAYSASRPETGLLIPSVSVS